MGIQHSTIHFEDIGDETVVTSGSGETCSTRTTGTTTHQTGDDDDDDDSDTEFSDFGSEDSYIVDSESCQNFLCKSANILRRR